jgi:predicted HAD superfamily Cof-like phosphohydrolase
MKKIIEDVKEFMEGVGQVCPKTPNHLDEETARLRLRLIVEETEEMAIALGFTKVKLMPVIEDVDFNSAQQNLVQIADAAADIVYVTIGTTNAAGINMEPVWDEVQRSNLSKLIDGFKRPSDGKWMKGPSYVPPDLESVVNRLKTEPME